MTTSEAFTAAHSDALRDWARGLYPLEAATELLIRACGGRFAAPGNPWVHVEDSGRAWIDFEELSEAVTAGGPWSGGERRILALAASFGADDGLLNDNLPGLDRDTLALVLAAVSHAGGSHEHQPEAILWDENNRPYRNPETERPGPLYPWPGRTH
ncbi:hypothetical protein [Nakamurella endophytica]|uniref:Uncharacterized protein n=1 Tax=Nakamurella endophytica TaxID=1748367 RepID=A0A917T681_9ACTN|nr:hypothetical protein [Nakamurella endophytica]GGM09615.1 hypothetical protein GCM10011594_31880 [Nakamurella endophytica]